MTILRDTSLQSKYHYARLLVFVLAPSFCFALRSLTRLHLFSTPTSPTPTTRATPIDTISLLSLTQKALGEWFGPAGAVSGVEVQVLLVELASAVDAKEGEREAVLRLPARCALHSASPGSPAFQLVLTFITNSTAHLPLTSLLLTPATYDGQSYSLRVLASSDDLAALGGGKGRGREGWKAWKERLSSGSVSS